jgi:hypothetical protein
LGIDEAIRAASLDATMRVDAMASVGRIGGKGAWKRERERGVFRFEDRWLGERREEG